MSALTLDALRARRSTLVRRAFQLDALGRDDLATRVWLSAERVDLAILRRLSSHSSDRRHAA